jgi:hypothetical protein
MAAAHDPLDPAILKRVIADDRQAASGCNQVRRLCQNPIKGFELIVYGYPKRLENPGERLLFLAAWRRVFDDARQLAGRRNGTGIDERVCDTRGLRFFSVPGQKTDQIAYVEAVDQICGVFSLVLIHAHVQGRIEPVAEAAASGIELMRRHAQIQQHAVYGAYTMVGQKLIGISEITLEENKTTALNFWSQPLTRRLQGIVVPIDSKDTTFGSQRFKQGFRVTSATQRSIHVRSNRVGYEGLDDIIPKNRRVIARSMFQ